MTGKMPGDYTDFEYPFAQVRVMSLMTQDESTNDERNIDQYLVVIGIGLILLTTYDRVAARHMAEDLNREAEVWAVRNGMKYAKSKP